MSSRDKMERSNKNEMEKLGWFTLKYFKGLELVCVSGVRIATAEPLTVRTHVLTSCGLCMSYHFPKTQEPRLVPRARGMS